MTRLWPDEEPIMTWGGQDMPTGFEWQGKLHYIQEICNHWQVHTRWWEPAETIWREYLKVTTDKGILCLIYRNLTNGNWFLARLYD